VRRATLEDLRALTALWTSMTYSPDELIRRVTEFQVAENGEGELVGAVGLQMAERQGLIHSEAFTDFALADPVRPLFWERINALSTNHGLHRLWTREQAPFWRHCGLALAETDALQKLPAVWRGHTSGWLTIKLREDLDSLLSADHELAMFMADARTRSQKTLQRARVLKTLALVIGFVVVMVILGAAFVLFLRRGVPLGLPRA